jgi:hypothetical protein
MNFVGIYIRIVNSVDEHLSIKNLENKGTTNLLLRGGKEVVLTKDNFVKCT